MINSQDKAYFSSNIQDAKVFRTFDSCSDAKLPKSQGGLVPNEDRFLVSMTGSDKKGYIIERTICLSTGAVDYLV